jgi:flagellar biogenesis protein FliO
VSVRLQGLTGELFGLAQALSALALLLAAVWLVRRLRTGGGFGAHKNRLLAIEERLPLDLRGGLVIVRAEGRRLLLSVSDHGPARLLTELERKSESDQLQAHVNVNERENGA